MSATANATLEWLDDGYPQLKDSNVAAFISINTDTFTLSATMHYKHPCRSGDVMSGSAEISLEIREVSLAASAELTYFCEPAVGEIALHVAAFVDEIKIGSLSLTYAELDVNGVFLGAGKGTGYFGSIVGTGTVSADDADSPEVSFAAGVIFDTMAGTVTVTARATLRAGPLELELQMAKSNSCDQVGGDRGSAKVTLDGFNVSARASVVRHCGNHEVGGGGCVGLSSCCFFSVAGL